MGLAGSLGATGVAAAGSTATAARAPAGAANPARCGVAASVAAGAEPVSGTVDRDAGSEWAAAGAATTACRTAWVSALAPDGIGSGDGGALVDASADEVPGDGDAVDGSSAAGGSGLRLDALAVAIEPVTPTDGRPTPLSDGDPWVAFLARTDPVDDGVGDPPASVAAEDDTPEVPGPALPSEPTPRLDDDELSEPAGLVLSAWAKPDPLAKAAPTPSVIAPAPSQPRATRGFGLAR